MFLARLSLIPGETLRVPPRDGLPGWFDSVLPQLSHDVGTDSPRQDRRDGIADLDGDANLRAMPLEGSGSVRIHAASIG